LIGDDVGEGAIRHGDRASGDDGSRQRMAEVLGWPASRPAVASTSWQLIFAVWPGFWNNRVDSGSFRSSK
jgi:hypothetical protein